MERKPDFSPPPTDEPRYYGTGNYGSGGAGFGGGLPETQSDLNADESITAEDAALAEGSIPDSYQWSDERIRADIAERLRHAHEIDSTAVIVAVEGARVTFDGTVPDVRMKHAIEELADLCPGVQDIQNRLRIV